MAETSVGGVVASGPLGKITTAVCILCGVAFTWACATLGMVKLTSHACRGNPTSVARQRVPEVRSVVTEYPIETRACPATRRRA